MKKNEVLVFYIFQYQDGYYRVETPDLRYRYRTGLSHDRLTRERLVDAMEIINSIMDTEYDVEVMFMFK